MGAQEDEKTPLVAPTVPSGLARAPTGSIAMTLPEPDGQRNWKGGLCRCFGDCDPEDCGSFFFATKCLPCAFLHNRKRAFNAPAHLWKFAIALTVLLYAWTLSVRVLSTRATLLCTQPAIEALSQLADPPPRDGPGYDQTFLTGATYQPQKFTLPEDEDSVETFPLLADEPMYEDSVFEDSEEIVQLSDETQGQAGASAQATAVASSEADLASQIQAAKAQAAAGMAQVNAQLGYGRKLLDKDGHGKKKGKDGKHKDGKHKDKKSKDKKSKDKKHEAEEHDWHPEPWGPHPPHHHEREFGEPGEGCIATIEALSTAMHVFYITAICFCVYAATVRTAIRERFGIPGSRVKDFLAWLCCPVCAVIQETRTLSANNVRGGVWFGPTVLATPAHPLQAPQPQAQPAKAAKTVDEGV